MSQEKYFNVLKSCRLFQNLPEGALQDVLKYLHAREHSYKKGEIILSIGQEIHYAGIVLEGEVECSFQDYDFNKYNMNHFSEGDLFAETMAFLDVANSPMQIFAVSDCAILLLDFSVFSDNKTNFEYQTLLMTNLIHLLAEQNFFLNQKVRLLGQKDLRSKILVYLKNLEADEKGYRKLPFSKTALAEFLCVDRAALSREIHNMINDGLLKMNGRIFLIL